MTGPGRCQVAAGIFRSRGLELGRAFRRGGELSVRSSASRTYAKAKAFTETRILQRKIKVRLLSAPASLASGPLPGAPTPAAASKTNGGLPALPAANTGATVIIGQA
jgi:hypothetical protein